jgi:hypothetical protein
MSEQLTHADYRKVLSNCVAGISSPRQLQEVMADLLDRLADECRDHRVSQQDPEWVKRLSGTLPRARGMTYNQWLEIEDGLMAGIAQDHRNEEEGSR